MRTFCFDEELHIQAYRFIGVFQPFPNHFHDHYMIEYMEDGYRIMAKSREFEKEAICQYMKDHYEQHVSLDDLCQIASLSKSTLLRAFTKRKMCLTYR